MRLLDLFCGEGGAAAGYARAGFDVVGVDLNPRAGKRYPFEFEAMDWWPALIKHSETVDAIHASPPCQGYSRGNAGRDTSWPRLIPLVRAALSATGKPYVIENVKDAGYDMVAPVALCGCMFGLSTIDTDGEKLHLRRLRLFESNVEISAPRQCDHAGQVWVAGAYGGARRDKYEAKYERKGGYVPPDKDVVQDLLGIEHSMTWNGLFESIPPAFTAHVGSQLAAKVAIAA